MREPIRRASQSAAPYADSGSEAEELRPLCWKIAIGRSSMVTNLRVLR